MKLMKGHHQEVSLWLNLSYHGRTAPMTSFSDTRFLQYGVVKPQDADVRELAGGEPLA